MHFKIVGANAESGDDVDVMLDAPSQNDVERIAHDRGILVASITAVADAPAHAPAAHAPQAAPAHKKVEPGAISLVDDPPAGAPGGNGHAPAPRQQGIITTNASNPGDTAHSAAGHAHEVKPEDSVAHYHVILNQSLYLLESAVNKHLKDGWVVQGGICVGVSNNAMQFFQGMLKPAKHAADKPAS